MKYALLIYETPEAFESRQHRGDTDGYVESWRAFHKAIVDAGVYAGGNPLQAPGTATTVRRRRSRRLVQDGPYAETKEHLGGFVVLELPSLEAALEWAERCPAAATGAVEVRPLATAMKDRIAGPAGEVVDPGPSGSTTS